MATDRPKGVLTSRREASEILAGAVVATALPSSVNATTPPDIDPQSGNRLPVPQRDGLDPETQRIFDQIVDPKGVTLRGLRGPGGIHLHSPKLAVLMRPLNNYLRNQSGLSGRVREIAILTAARACDSQFEWVAHEKEALKEGVPPAAIDVIKYRKATAGLEEADAVIIDLCRGSFVTRNVPPALYERALKIFGKQQLVDLVILMGYYVMTAGMLVAFDMQLDPGQTPDLPMP